MDDTSERLPGWVRETREPNPRPPAGSCDCQFHIFEDQAQYPTKPSPPYQPPLARFSDILDVHKALGIDRGVIVHSVVYGSDHRSLLDTLEGLPPELKGRYKGTCILEDKVSDSEIARLDAAGVCGARVNFVRYLEMTPSDDLVRRSFDRIREIGWHARLHVTGDQLLENSDFLRSVKDVPMVIDHMAHIGRHGGMEQPAFQWMIDRLRHDENWWMMVSNGNRDSKLDSGWDDAVPFGKAFIEAAPDRVIWGTDWPHPGWRKKRMMNEAETVELLYSYIDRDPGLMQKILVDNPARLHGFKA